MTKSRQRKRRQRRSSEAQEREALGIWQEPTIVYVPPGVPCPICQLLGEEAIHQPSIVNRDDRPPESERPPDSHPRAALDQTPSSHGVIYGENPT